MAVAAAKEAEEQAALPYKWTQTIGELDVTVELPGNIKGKDLNVDIKKKKLLLGVKGQEPIINVCCTVIGLLNTTILRIITGRFTTRYPRRRVNMDHHEFSLGYQDPRIALR